MKTRRKTKLPAAPIVFQWSYEGFCALITLPQVGQCVLLAPTVEALEYHARQYGLKKLRPESCRAARLVGR